MKRVLSVLCAMLLLCLCCPFGVATAEEARTVPFSELHGYFRAIGRTVEHNNCLYMDNTASGFEFYFYGSGDVALNATVVCSTKGEIAQYLTVVVDGVRERVRIACNARDTEYFKSIPLASGLSDGYHHIEVYRQTEAQVSSFRAESLTFSGRLMATPGERPLTIDVIGDSISGGYGCLWNSSLGVADPNENHPYYEDGTQSYAFLAGKALGANVRVTQSSGYGCVAGWNGRSVNLQMMYPYLNWFRSQSFLNIFDPLADIVVINLGTNDYNTRNNNNMSNAEFQEGAKNLMQMAKQYNPGATVVWCTGMMGTYYEKEVKAAIAELGGIDAGYHFLLLPNGQGGAVSHPTAAQQAAAGEVLANYLKTNVLPADHTSQTATTAQLQSVIDQAKSINSPSAALRGAIERAEMEIAVNTTDAYRLYARMADLREAMNGEVTAVSLLPKQYISTTPTAADGLSYIWPYYGADGTVTLYKGGDGFYWPQVTTYYYETVDIDETPYLRVEFASTAAFNANLHYRANGVEAYVNLSELAGISEVDFPATDRTALTVDFGAYIRAQGQNGSDGLVSLVSCDLYAIGEPDSFVKLYEATFTDKAPDAPLGISGRYTVTDGVLTNVPLFTTTTALIGAMDNGQYLRIVEADGTAPSKDVLKTGMKLQLVVSGTVTDEAVISVTGDVNGDGDMTTADARAVLLSVVGLNTPSSAAVAAGDLNGSGALESLDARNLLMTIINL